MLYVDRKIVSKRDTNWYAVRVQGPEGIVGVHYVETKSGLVHPEMWSAQQERDKGYEVLSVWKHS